MSFFYKFGSFVTKKEKRDFLYAIKSVEPDILETKETLVKFPKNICRNVIGIDERYLQQESKKHITIFTNIAAIVFSINKSDIYVYALCSQSQKGHGKMLLDIVKNMASYLKTSVALSSVDSAVEFYIKNGFMIKRTYITPIYNQSSSSSSSTSSSSSSSSSSPSYEDVVYHDMIYKPLKKQLTRTRSFQKFTQNSTRKSNASI